MGNVAIAVDVQEDLRQVEPVGGRDLPRHAPEEPMPPGNRLEPELGVPHRPVNPRPPPLVGHECRERIEQLTLAASVRTEGGSRGVITRLHGDAEYRRGRGCG